MYNRFQIGFSLSVTDNRLCLLAGASRLFFLYAVENQVDSASDNITASRFVPCGTSIKFIHIRFI